MTHCEDPALHAAHLARGRKQSGEIATPIGMAMPSFSSKKEKYLKLSLI